MKQYSDTNLQHTHGVENRSTPDPATWFKDPAHIYEEACISDISKTVRSIELSETPSYSYIYNSYYVHILQNYSLQKLKKCIKSPFQTNVQWEPIPWKRHTKKQKTKKIHNIKNGYNSSRSYLSLLEDLSKDDMKYTRPERCGRFGKLYNCEQHDQNYLYDPKPCGHRKACVICGHQYSMSLGMNIMELFNVISDTYADSSCINVTWTVPDQVREILTYENIKRFVGCATKTMNEYYNGLMPGGVVITHTWYSSQPLKGWYPHLHSMWSNYAYDKKTSSFVRINHYLDPDQLVQFKKLWRDNLVKEFKECKIPETIDLNWSYLKVNKYTRSRLFHRIKYNTRLPQFDITNYSREEGILSYTPQEKSVIEHQIRPPNNWRRIRWVGWCSDRNKHKYWNAVHPDTHIRTPRQISADEKNTSSLRCDICNRELHFVDFITVEELHRENISYRVNPDFKYQVTLEKRSDH